MLSGPQFITHQCDMNCVEANFFYNVTYFKPNGNYA